MGITDYGHRGVPNVLLDAPLHSKGTWNAAHFKNPTYDGLVDGVHGGARPRRAAGRGEADPGAAARRDADHLPVLLLLPDRREEAVARRARCRHGHWDVTSAGHLDGRSRGRWPSHGHGSSPSGSSRPRSRCRCSACSSSSWRRCCRATSGAASSARSPTGGGRRAQPGARHRPPARRPVPRLDRRLAQRRHGPVAHVRQPGLGRALGRRSSTPLKLALLAFLIVVPLVDLGGVSRRCNEGSLRDRVITSAACRRPPCPSSSGPCC